MKNKKIVISFFSLFILVIAFGVLDVNAKTYSAADYSFTKRTILEPGDVLDFSSGSNTVTYILYLDDSLITSDCFGVKNECSTQFVVKDKMIYEKTMGGGTIDNEYKYGYFRSIKEDAEIISLDISDPIYRQNWVDERYYKSGDILLISYNDRHGSWFNIYDKDNNIISSGSIWDVLPGLVILPKIDGKDVYWRHEIIMVAQMYNFPVPIFTPIDYTEPKIELKCDKDKINYGEKTKCEVSIECTHVLNKLEFSMNQKDLKFTNYSFSNGITNTGNNNSIKLNITDNNICNEKKTIMTFDVEGTKNSTYLDKLSLNDIEYTDELLTAKYNDLDSNLNIISTNNIISNPKTGTRIMFIIIPIIILLIVGILSVFKKKNKATN